MAKSSRISQIEKRRRDPEGKFSRKDDAFYGTYVCDKGYIRISAGPFRGMRLHTLIAMAMKGRKLRKDEDAHHKNGDKLNPCPLCNLEVLGHREHGAVSAAQHQFLRRKEAADKQAWEAIHGSLSSNEENERNTDDHAHQED